MNTVRPIISNLLASHWQNWFARLAMVYTQPDPRGSAYCLDPPTGIEMCQCTGSTRGVRGIRPPDRFCTFGGLEPFGDAYKKNQQYKGPLLLLRGFKTVLPFFLIRQALRNPLVACCSPFPSTVRLLFSAALMWCQPYELSSRIWICCDDDESVLIKCCARERGVIVTGTPQYLDEGAEDAR